MDIPRVKEFLESAAGGELKEFLQNAVYSLKNIDGMRKFWSKKKQNIEILATKKAYQKLEEILNQLSIWESEKIRTAEEEKIDTERDRYSFTGKFMGEDLIKSPIKVDEEQKETTKDSEESE